MPAFLVPVDSGQCLIPLEKAVVLIGRQADCDVSLTHSRKISRKHCCIAQVNNKFVVRDLGSTNGVFLNGNRIAKEAVLTVGDQLTIGDVRFKVQSEAPVMSKEKAGQKAGAAKQASAAKPVSPSAQRAPSPLPPPANHLPLVAPPSMDFPVAIDEAGNEFSVESTNQHPIHFPLQTQSDEIDESMDDDDDEIQPFKLASDE